MICPSCKKENSIESLFCPHCGEKFQSISSEKPIGLGKKIWEMLKVGRYIILACLLAFLAYQYFVYGSVTGEIPIEISANEIALAYTENSSNANSKFKDKLVEISGEVVSKGQFSNSSNLYLSLKNYQNNTEVLINFPSDQQSKVNSIKYGDFITVRGVCIGIVDQDDPAEISIQIGGKSIDK